MSIPLYKPILAYYPTLIQYIAVSQFYSLQIVLRAYKICRKNAYLVCLNESIQIIIELSLYISCIFIRFDLLALSRNEC